MDWIAGRNVGWAVTLVLGPGGCVAPPAASEEGGATSADDDEPNADTSAGEAESTGADTRSNDDGTGGGSSSTGTTSGGGGTRGSSTGTSSTGSDGGSTTTGDAADESGDTGFVPGDPGELPGRVPLDCGPDGVAIVDAGPTQNRVNYVIVGDGYTASELDTTFLEHVDVAMQKRFHEVIGQPYLRYRKFVNICAIKVESPGAICGNSALGCCGDDESRLAQCDGRAADQAMADALPDDFEIDWKAVVLNGDRWWNTGAVLMLWSGAHQDADGAALHEGGHGFHRLADEYTSSSTNGCTTEGNEVNSTADRDQTAGKWDRWLGYEDIPGTGLQGAFEGSRYCNTGQFRPSDNSMMNSLFGDADDTAFNPVSREKIVMDVWRVVQPIDAAEPPPGPVADPSALTVWVVDPEVIDVDWYVDDTLFMADGGGVFDVAAAGLAPGEHTIEARAYDDAGEDLVRYRDGGEWGRENWARSRQAMTWTVTISP